MFKEQMRQLAGRMRLLSADMTRGYQSTFPGDVFVGSKDGKDPQPAPERRAAGGVASDVPADAPIIQEQARAQRR